jgi:poly(beta-D-mannuronate) lyase
MKRKVARLATIFYGLVIPAALFAAEPPSKTLDLSNWVLTLPEDTDLPGAPDEIRQPQLESFMDPRYFFSRDPDGVIFRAHCGGKTTKGSSYPRCELREMTNLGMTRAGWDTDTQSKHRLRMTAAITKIPPVKQHVVCAQIHHADDDLMMIRLEGKKLFVERNSVGDVMLDREYKLGSPFELKIQASAGRVKVWYDGDLKMTWKVSRQGCYFKAGCYTQSNISKGDAADSYGEVVIYRLKVDQDGP